ncbi:signal transduction histidine kinase [Rhizomicrobium palustre]|uniref:histidine kinase n=1 Tax=Rhizomicrobium palustre TaxID=189966 RepID=A0A846MVB4_9PROT|nr:HAMP domain-containing sensor histidine kinase [Rhizomicrobium palustre]NIK87165.1 signal transduction histidine kinase [Rhizomicrobium palustre]
MRLAQTLRSASFKLSAAYVGLFTVSVGVLAGLTYLLAVSRLEADFRTHIEAETHMLSGEYASGGAPSLLHAISERLRNRLAGGLDYTVIDAQGRRLAGALPPGSCDAGWKTIYGPPDGDEPAGQLENLAVLVTPLPQGYCLMIGDDFGKVSGFGSLILRTFGWVILVSLTLAVAGGIFLSSRFLKRIDAINRTAEAIIEGDIRQRIPRRAAPDDLDRLAATLNRMLDRTTELMESLRHVTSDIAHDLRTPLGRLRNQLEDAKATAATPDEFRVTTERAIAEVDGLLTTFSAILRIAQIESGSRRAGFKPLSLSALVNDIGDSFEDAIAEAGKSLRIAVAPDVVVQGDAELLSQALINLLENAVLHTPRETAITISLELCEGQACLSVSDNGPGVPEADRERIFKRFFRLERSRSSAGNGLGLSIVSAVTQLHGAQITVCDNKPGLNVTLRLPIYSD